MACGDAHPLLAADSGSMKVVFLIRSLEYGGAERQLVMLARGCRARGLATTVVVFYPGGVLEGELRAEAVPVRSLDKRGRWEVARFLLRLGRMLREERPDILHGYLEVSNLLTVLFKPLLPRTKAVWGIRASNVDLRRYGWVSRLNFRLQRLLSRYADLLIVNSKAGLSYHVARGFPGEKMVVVPNGIDTGRFRRDHEGRRRVREAWRVGDDEDLIGLVGRFDPMKDHRTFLQAAALLAKARDTVRFVCVGDGPARYREELRALGEELGLARRVIWAGARTDMPAVYSALDILSLSSAYGEGFPNVVGEAMACGVPCVVTDVGDAAWIVGDTGVVVPSGDPRALAEGWGRVLGASRHHRSALGQQARARIVREFGLEAFVQRTCDTLAALLR